MKLIFNIFLVSFLVIVASQTYALEIQKSHENVKIEKITFDELRSIKKLPLYLNLSPAESCPAGNTDYMYTITNMLYGAEHFSAFVDPSSCYITNPGVVRVNSISIVVYATAEILNCSGFELQAHIESAEWSGNCPSPGYQAECTSDYTVMQITSPGLYLLTFSLNEDCLRFGPFFASVTFFNNAGCLPGPLNIVVDDWPEFCNSYNNYEGVWYDIVASYGLVGKLSLFATVDGLDPVPQITSVKDVPYDQGGAISLRWSKSALDSSLFSSVTHYSLWRRLKDSSKEKVKLTSEMSPATSFNTPNIPINFEGRAIYKTENGFAWEWLANVPAHSFDTYAYTVKSLYDSTSTSTNWQYFMVTACTDEPFLYWDSPVDSGYSVDNLSPSPPANLTGRQLEHQAGLLISWSPNEEEDFKQYKLHSSTVSNFVLDENTLIATLKDTFFIDTSWNPSQEKFYMVVAEDIHGNTSKASSLTPDDIEVETALLSYSTELNPGKIILRWETSKKLGAFRIYRLIKGESYPEIINIDIEEITENSYILRDTQVTSNGSYRYTVKYIKEDGRENTLFQTDFLKPLSSPFILYQNHPNPFNPSTTIEFSIPAKGKVSISIFDSSGKLIKELLKDKSVSEGRHNAVWDGSNGAGKRVPSGIYFYRLTFKGKSITKKMVLIR